VGLQPVMASAQRRQVVGVGLAALGERHDVVVVAAGRRPCAPQEDAGVAGSG
jgi:hypothetical protein